MEKADSNLESNVQTSQLSNIASLLNRSRQSLLDLSLRNRLLNVPKQSKNARVVSIVDELSSEVYRLLVQEDKPLSFLPGREVTTSNAEDNEDREIYY